jgi:hypothetical protein
MVGVVEIGGAVGGVVPPEDTLGGEGPPSVGGGAVPAFTESGVECGRLVARTTTTANTATTTATALLTIHFVPLPFWDVRSEAVLPGDSVGRAGASLVLGAANSLNEFSFQAVVESLGRVGRGAIGSGLPDEGSSAAGERGGTRRPADGCSGSLRGGCVTGLGTSPTSAIPQVGQTLASGAAGWPRGQLRN